MYIYMFIYIYIYIYTKAHLQWSSSITTYIVGAPIYIKKHIYIYIQTCIFENYDFHRLPSQQLSIHRRAYNGSKTVMEDDFGPIVGAPMYVSTSSITTSSKVVMEDAFDPILGAPMCIYVGAPMYIYTSSITTSSKVVMEDAFDPNTVSQICMCLYIHRRAYN